MSLVATIHCKVYCRWHLEPKRLGHQGQVQLINRKDGFEGMRSVRLDIPAVGVLGTLEQVEVLRYQLFKLK